MSTADKFIRSGVYKNALVISAEVNSKMMDFTDRTSTVFFGDGNDEWIQAHTGIKERRISLQGENTSDLATQAARMALAQTDLNPEDIELIIVTTFTPDGLAPSTAALVMRLTLY
ncbi:hypothetical protein H7R52_05135 [Weissella confusa]|uniref:Beta-ketoacyl-[acyl-carrier-protein] synthase III N-terminal domain-containing protein n=1 Tax=Weissella confusa TaxID=1583 RepID=A0A923NII0_WEICO|nr:hypothetical protein [Weissella confusa]